MTTKSNNTEAATYPESKLCNTSTRQPPNDPYCVKGKNNSALFWRGLGGKKRKTKRMNRKGRKTRKH